MAKKKTPKGPLLPAVFIDDMEPVFPEDGEGAHGGIGLRNVESPLVVYLINPKDGVGPGSVATLFWTNTNVAVASTVIREEDKDQVLIPLTVPQHRVVEFFANPVYAKLKRSGGNESFTEEIKVRVRLNRPGGDPGPGPGHKGLQYEIPPEILLGGVSEAQAQAGVKITIRYWQYMRAYDLIRLAWGSQTIERRVLPGEEGHDIVVTVDYETIKKAGNNRLTRVAHQVRDCGGNLPAEAERWSASSWIDVHLSEKRPDAPWLKFPNTHPNSIDLSELGSWDVEIELWATSAETGAYSHVTLIWDAKDSEGNAVPHTETRPLNGVGLYVFTIANALVEAIASGTANVHALYQRAGGEQPSQKLYLDVFGQIVRWPAPQIKEDLGGHVDPAFDATVYFPLQGSWPDNGYIEVIFRVSTPDNSIEYRTGREVDDVPPTPGGNLEFTIPAAELKRFEGHLVDVFYAHTRPGSKPQESLRLQVIIGVLERTMPAPIIDKEIGGQLNPDDVGAFAKVFSTFTETERLDWIRMFWNGPRGRTEVPVQVAVNGATTEHDIDKVYLMDNLEETVAVFYSLTRGDQMPRYSQITEVLISRNLVELAAPTLLGSKVIDTDIAELEPLDVQMGTQLVVAYVGMRDGDSIKVIMVGSGNGGSPDIPPVPGNQASQEVAVDITAAAIAANLRDHATTVTFNYVVTRAGVAKTSRTLTVTVKPIPLANLPRPLINGVAHNQTLDVASLPANAQITIAQWPLQYAGMKIWLSYHCVGANPSTNVIWAGAQHSSDNGLTYAAPLAWLATCPNGAKISVIFKVTYDPNTNEAGAVSFPVTEYTTNSLPDTFPVPKLTQATGTGNAVTLAPLNAQNGATVSVEYLPMYTSDSIKAIMEGTVGAGSPVITAKPGVTGGVVTFAIPKAGVAANIGNVNKPFKVRYEVTRNGVVRSSVVLTVTVTPIPQANLPRPLIDRVAHGGTLNVAALTTATRWRIDAYPFQIANEQLIWLTYTGTNTSNQAVTSAPWVAAPNPHAGAYEYQPDINWLKTLKHGSQLTIEVRLAFDYVNNKNAAVVFPVTQYTVSNVQIPAPIDDFTPFTNNNLNNWSTIGGGASIVIEGGNYFWRRVSPSDNNDSAIGLHKPYASTAGRSFEISFKYRISALSRNGSTLLNVQLGNETPPPITITKAGVWLDFKYTSSPQINQGVSIRYTGWFVNDGNYEFDDIRVRELS